jgi:hypothetical protein
MSEFVSSETTSKEPYGTLMENLAAFDKVAAFFNEAATIYLGDPNRINKGLLDSAIEQLEGEFALVLTVIDLLQDYDKAQKEMMISTIMYGDDKQRVEFLNSKTGLDNFRRQKVSDLFPHDISNTKEYEDDDFSELASKKYGRMLKSDRKALIKHVKTQVNG